MIHIKLLLTLMVISLSSALYGMEKEQSSFSKLPTEIRQQIASLLLEKTAGKNTYSFLKKINIEASLGDYLERMHMGDYYSIAFSPDGSDLIIMEKSSIYFCTIETEEQKTFLRLPVGFSARTFNPNNNTAIVKLFNKILLFSLKEEAGLESVKEHTLQNAITMLTRVSVSPDNTTLAVAISPNSTVYLYDIETGSQLKEFEAHCVVHSIVFSPEGKTVLTGGRNGIAYLYDVETGNKLKEFKGHTNKMFNIITSVAFSPDGKAVLTGSFDKTVRLWNVETGELLKEFKDQTAAVTSVAFSKDGKMIAIASNDGNIIVYRLYKEFSKEAPESECREKVKLLLNPDAITIPMDKEYSEKVKFLLNHTT